MKNDISNYRKEKSALIYEPSLRITGSVAKAHKLVFLQNQNNKSNFPLTTKVLYITYLIAVPPIIASKS